MKTGLISTAASNSMVYQWLFRCGSHAWTNGQEITIDAILYSSIVSVFSGIDLKKMDPVAGVIPPHIAAVSVWGSKIDFDPEAETGQPMTISLYANGAVRSSWSYEVNRLTFAYGLWKWELIDFLSPHLGKEHPRGAIVSSLETSTPMYGYAGSAKACVPDIYGRVKIPVRGAFVSDQRYVFIGPVGGTYTIYGAETPVEWDEHSEYVAGDYTFSQAEKAGYQVVTGTENATGPWSRAGQIYDAVVEYDDAATASLTNPADVLSGCLQHYIPSSMIDITGTWATADATYNAITGLSFNVGFNTRQSLKKNLCALLTACNSIFRYSDKIELVYLDDATVRDYDRNRITNLTFTPIDNDTEYDGTTVGYFPDVQGGEPTKIAVAVDGTTATNPDGDVVIVLGVTDTELIQKIGIRHAREKYLKVGTLTFSDPFSLDIEPGDKITITGDALYRDYLHCYVERVQIGVDPTSVSITAGVFAEDLGDLDTFAPSTVVPDTDASVFIRPVSEKWLKRLYARSVAEPELPTEENPSGWAEAEPAGTDTLYYIEAWFGADNHFWPGCTWMAVHTSGGQPGPQGDTGPGLTYQGLYSAAAQYLRTAVHRDVVTVSGAFYAAVQSSQGQPVSDPDYWAPVPGFASFATGILLVDDANILKTLNVGWSPTGGPLADCCIRSGMTDPYTGTGFYFGRVSGYGVASIRQGDSIFIMDEGGDDFQIGNSNLLLDFTTSEFFINAAGVLTIAGSVSLESGSGMAVKNGGGITLEGGTGLRVSGGADITVDDGGRVIVEGGGGQITVRNGASFLLTAGCNMYVSSASYINLANGGYLLVDNAGHSYPPSIQFRNSDVGVAENTVYARMSDDGVNNILRFNPDANDEVDFAIGHSSFAFKDVSIHASAKFEVNCDSFDINVGASMASIASSNGITLSTDDEIHIGSSDVFTFSYDSTVYPGWPAVADLPDKHVLFFLKSGTTTLYCAYRSGATIHGGHIAMDF